MRMVDVRIITNSIFVANSVRSAHNVNVTLLEGSYRPLSQSNVGPLVQLCVNSLEPSKIFAGMSGWARCPGRCAKACSR